MAYRDCQSDLAGQFPEAGLPGLGPVAVGPARVGGDQQGAGAGIMRLRRPFHQRRKVSTANTAVSWSIPTLTQPVLRARS